MHISLALLFLAVCRSSAISFFDKCEGYKPFVKKWICPSKDIKYNSADINEELGNNTSKVWKQYDGETNAIGTEDCVKDEPTPDPYIARPVTRYRRIELHELCEMVKVDIRNVYRSLNIGGVSKQYECIVVNTGWMTQDIHYARCVNPVTRSHDKCQFDYSSRDNFRCIQSGFVRKRVLLFCPDANDYVFSTYLVPTTCSCRKCTHCENKNSFMADLLNQFG